MFNTRQRWENIALKKAVENNSAANAHYKAELTAMNFKRLCASLIATLFLSTIVYYCA